MTAITKKKLCWNCEGRVSSQEENCPFCGVYINGTLQMSGHEEEEDDQEELVAIPLPLDNSGHNNSDHRPLYTPVEPPKEKVSENKEMPVIQSSKGLSKEVLPLLLLISGSVLFIFSLALMLFSQEGVFTLQWDATVWYIYLAIALPGLFFGWRLLDSLQEE